MRTAIVNDGCPADFRYEYDEGVREAIDVFSKTKDEAGLNDTLLIECPKEDCARAFELYYIDFCGTRDVRNRVLGTVCLREMSS